jgi:type II secretory pathway component PulK
LKGFDEKMKKPRSNGFVLILVITAIAVIGVEMVVLTDGANTMLFQSDTVYLKACERNLMASGLAWAKLKVKNNNRDTFDKTTELDISKMNIKDSGLSVTITIKTDKEPQAQIHTSCSRGRRNIKNDRIFSVGL